MHLFLPALFILLFGSKINDQEVKEPPVRIEMTTNYGVLILRLYDETPLHRDNFIQLVEKGTYDSLLFHRIIENFMVQAGDVNSKSATLLDTLGGGDLGYRVPAEIRSELFHKKGAIGAARTNNPERASSSTQFYLVQGRIQNDSLLNHNQNRINQFLATHYAQNDPANKPLLDSLSQARELKDSVLIKSLSEKWSQISRNYSNFDRYEIPENHKAVYKEIGGTPHLDMSYTVFGEVEKGLEVIDAMAAVETNSMDRPLTEVRILKMRILEN
ncbi:peptidyl-prolyl cis-trans isomerase B (cyclophilin B) [Algoriphagus boseongensis]|uniref:peptidylprolyl isomerase n=1 Tax=Algoriphagus boseongensis TaxID=1442587 RepID=A0A4R6TAZ6_9BACT|nr:peptidylprolyl isomerase [Algoriphagus boseongensis]TDQ18825.1 peptidyl-prolyl cis-trans isomerase B (cyclophilin B) [Algoriphagus boseongensis]